MGAVGGDRTAGLPEVDDRAPVVVPAVWAGLTVTALVAVLAGDGSDVGRLGQFVLAFPWSMAPLGWVVDAGEGGGTWMRAAAGMGNAVLLHGVLRRRAERQRAGERVDSVVGTVAGTRVVTGGVLVLVAVAFGMVLLFGLWVLAWASAGDGDGDGADDAADPTAEVCGLDAGERDDLDELFEESVHAGLGIDDRLAPFRNCYLDGSYVLLDDVERIGALPSSPELVARLEPLGWAVLPQDLDVAPASDLLFVQEPAPPARALLRFEQDGDAVRVRMTVEEP